MINKDVEDDIDTEVNMETVKREEGTGKQRRRERQRKEGREEEEI